MHPKPKQARKQLLRALEALQDPMEFCKQEGCEESDRYLAQAYVVGAVRQCIEFALHELGEPIDPYRPIGVPYHPCESNMP